ncbi:T9SS type A sorting domain-containing protein [Salinimicrobium oceani]|uniref:T9SS type A sorting domain-containing protein n=1 Tax=Salinimicrobium oceani TaxID=2722702 RepID=A0ABX1CUF1_9FLAO|nr:T9SS type A sorting domain-containing protein [Salinimicrobium oceani]NJW51918.1 T9SS type A sorting domain-containing protein [Salinimicrobium oceani]
MVKKLLSKVITFWALLLTSALGWGQCPTSVSISADPGTTICAGTSVTFTANANGGSGTFSYEWKVDGAAVGSNSSEFTSSSLENGDKITVTVRSSDSSTCSTTSSAYTMTVNSNKTPTVSITASDSSICPGDSVTFTALNTNGGTNPQYVFYLNSNTTPLQSGSSNKYTTTTLNDGDKIKVVLTSSLDCTTSKTAEAISNSIEVRAGTPATPGAIATSVGSSICPGTSQTYSINAITGATSYQWTIPSGWTGSSSSTSINVTAGTTSGSISVKAINDCGTSEPQSLQVNLKDGTPAIPGNITGNATVCPGVSQTYTTTAVTGATEYIWTLPNGWTGTSSTNTIDVTTGNPGSGNISVQAKNDCGTSTAKTLAVSVKPGTPVQPGAISGTTAVCPGVSQTYSITAVSGATSYEWRLPDSSWVGTSTTNSITVTPGTTNGNISVKAINDCGTSIERNLALTVKPGIPAQPENITGPAEVCPGLSGTYTVPVVSGASQYIWTIPSGFSATSLTTTTPILTISAGSSGSGNITVKATNDCGTSATRTMAISIGKPAPVMSGSITGPTKVCAAATGLVYSLPAITNATEYNWTLPTGWTITSGVNTRSITVSAGSTSPSNNTISVAAKNACGTSTLKTLTVTASNNVPAQPGAISTNLTTSVICPPVNNITFSVPETSGLTYNWTLPAGFQVISGAGTAAITVNITTTAAYGNNIKVEVEAVNACGPSAGRSSYSNINLDKFVVANLGEDLIVCSSTTTLNLSGYIAFGNNNSKLKIGGITTTGTNTVQGLPNGNVNDFTYNYTPSNQDLAAGKVTFTLSTEKPAGSCNAGSDEMTVFFKPLPSATITSTGPICSGNTSTLTFTGTPNSRVTYKLPSGTNQTIDIGASGTANLTTSALTANSTYFLVSAINLDTPACSNTLSGSTTITVTPKPTANLSYAGSPFCTSLTSGQNPSLTGTNTYQGGTYSSTSGLTLNGSTGAITPSTSTPGTYIVTYSTPSGGGCEPVITTTQVTITKQPTAAISYDGIPFCTSDSAAKAVTLTGTDGFSGGTYSAPAGLTINTSTGDITPGSSTAGTYTITYNTPSAGGCNPVTATTVVTITKAPTITNFSYPGAPFCKTDNSEKQPTLEGTDAYTGGTYSAPPGLSINTITGAINASSSESGIYTVIYTAPASAGCEEVTATTEVKITLTPAAEISYTGPYCTSDSTAYTPVFSNTSGIYEGGVFRSTPQGLNLDPTSGVINASASSPNTYNVFYELPAGEGCSTSEIQTSVTISQVPQVGINYPTPLCTSDTASHAVTFSESSKGAYLGGSFSSTSGLAIDSAGNIIAANSTPGVHTVTYTTQEANGCGPVSVTTEIEIFEEVRITTEPINIGVCSTEPASFEVVATGDDLTYQWKRTDGAAITNATGINSAKLSFSNATATNAGEYFVEVSGSSPCSMVSSEPVTLNIDENIIIIKPTEDLTFCDQERADVTFEFIAHAKGAALTFTWIKDGVEIPGTNTDRFEFDLTGPVGANGEYTGTFKIIEPNPSDNGVYAVRIKGPEYFTCSDATSKTFTLNVTALPEPPTVEPVVLCQGETASPLTATGEAGATFKWYDANMQPIDGVPTPSSIEAGDTSYFVTQTTEVCESNTTELVVTVKPTPALPTTEEEVHYCFEEENVSSLSATGTDTNAVINWYGPNDPSVKLSTAPTPSTTTTGNTIFWVSQSIGDCESELVEILVVIDPLPEIEVTADAVLLCKGSSTVLHATGADNYSWSLNGTELATTADYEVSPDQTTTYTLTGTNDTGCVNTTAITIEVDEPTVPGTLTGPERVCVSSPTGTLNLADHTGAILRWESSTDGGVTWTEIASTAQVYEFTGLATATIFRAVVKNGVCSEMNSNEIEVTIDQLPVGGELAFAGNGRVFTICENPVGDYAVDLNLTGSVGEVVKWGYRSWDATGYTDLKINGELFTGITLTAAQLQSLNFNETTVFQVEISNGACAGPAYSKTAILSVIPSDITPSPVTVDPGVVCLGEEVTLSSETGYENGGTILDQGAFDNASITNHGWRIRRKLSSGQQSGDLGFDTDANNTVFDRWKRATPRAFTTASINSPYGTSGVVFDTGIEDGNKGFALVSGNNSSTMETPVFTIGSMDQAILTFDQAYVLTPGASLRVEISTDGGNTYTTLYIREVPATATQGIASGNTTSFGTGTIDSHPENKILIDLGDYMGRPNLRIRFNYTGARSGDIWAVDNIDIPEGPNGITMEWRDYTDESNPDGILIGTNNTEKWPPTQVGLNVFEIKTKLVYNSNGDACEVAENAQRIEVFVFDKYTTSVTAEYGSCGNFDVQLTAIVTNGRNEVVSNYPTPDGYIGRWEIEGGTLVDSDPTDEIAAVNDPNAILAAGATGTYSVSWILEPTSLNDNGNLYVVPETCPITVNPLEIIIEGCMALDFDGFDDYVDLGTNYTGNNYSIEAWIRPFDRTFEGGSTDASTGTIISGPGFEIKMENLPVPTNGRWYHIAYTSDGKLFIDGIPQETNSITGTGGSQTLIGARWNSSTKEAENHFSGWIEEVRLWKKPLTEGQVRFMMNQRLIANGAQMGEQIPMNVPEGLTYTDLEGYYRLISADPEPLTTSPVTYLAEDMPANGLTPDRATTKVPGRLVNMETNQENTAPLPYYSGNDGVWGTDATWLRPDVWDPPHTGPIEWNIARTSHNITSGNRDIFLLGLISEVNTLDMEGVFPSNSWASGGTGNQLFLSHYLLLNGQIDLNGESQLLQPMNSIVDSNSKGKLLRDQQGTASSYNYNYWSSPVSSGASNSPYSVGAVMMDGSLPTPQGLNFGTAYAHADGDFSTPRKVSEYWLHKFHGTANNYFQWEHIGSAGTLNVGEGYSMKGTSGSAPITAPQNYTFQGLPNNGTIEMVNMSAAGEGENYLIGNPYPSAIDAHKFIDDNLANGKNVFNGVLYFWDHFSGETHYLEEYVGGYAYYTKVGGTEAVSTDERINANNSKGTKRPRQFIPVGQGFFVITNLDPAITGTTINGGQVIFQNSQRAFIPESTSESVFHSQEKKDLPASSTSNSYSEEVEQNKIWLKFKSPKGYHRQILVAADKRATDNFDLGFDAPLIEDNVEDMYWYFNNYQFVIQGVPDFDLERVLDLGIKVDQQGSLSISIDDLENIPDEMNIYLADSLKQVVHNLREAAYQTESEAGVFTDRFKLVFQDKTPDIEPEDPVVIEEGPFEVIYITGTRNILLKNPELVEVDRVYLNNMLGQQVHVYYNVPLDREVELPVNRFSAGVYIVKVHTEQGTFTKKVILE